MSDELQAQLCAVEEDESQLHSDHEVRGILADVIDLVVRGVDREGRVEGDDRRADRLDLGLVHEAVHATVAGRLLQAHPPIQSVVIPCPQPAQTPARRWLVFVPELDALRLPKVIGPLRGPADSRCFRFLGRHQVVKRVVHFPGLHGRRAFRTELVHHLVSLLDACASIQCLYKLAPSSLLAPEGRAAWQRHHRQGRHPRQGSRGVVAYRGLPTLANATATRCDTP
mmetsp:Transcript_61094/g.164419  ORF Transcript_61094/g.164419 Transcript_61094/m.164419 type:complete len:226 (-) Transcript_61094:430-1107(-)